MRVETVQLRREGVANPVGDGIALRAADKGDLVLYRSPD
jgi:hypothetical protein